MSEATTTVTIPRQLFDKVVQLAKRQHRSARGQILHLLAVATEDIEAPGVNAQKRKLTAREIRQAEAEAERYAERIEDGRQAEAYRMQREAAQALLATNDASYQEYLISIREEEEAKAREALARRATLKAELDAADMRARAKEAAMIEED